MIWRVPRVTAKATARRRALLRFTLKLAAFALPFAILYALLTGFLIYTGESMPLAMVAQMQLSDEPVLYRPRYGNRDLEFKTLSANLRQPEVLLTGSSRVLQFRAQFFNKAPRAFYNAGAPAWMLSDVLEFLDGLTYTPRVLIVGLDAPWFNDAYTSDPIPAPVDDLTHIITANRGFLQDVLNGESFDIGRYLARVEPGHGELALGLRAIRDGHGFRNDGSEQYGDFLVAHWLYPENERQRHLDYLREGADMYVYGDTVSSARWGELTELIRWCTDHNVTLIGFLPPYMPSLYEQMIEDGNHTYIQQLDAQLQALFDHYDFPYFNFSDGAALGATDDDFFDGWHASEQINLRLYERMFSMLRAQQPGLLDAYTDPNFLAAVDASATDTFDVFGDATAP
ncbi:MAG: hypothetical protein IT319_05205 [Anaerolineae bacterium]|nr:hypothetical protein [Anaerolineae bacterium]